jgi:hypothetical protein
MKNRSLVPAPWRQVGLTVLPGLVFLLHQSFSLQVLSETAVHLLGWASLLFLIVSSIWLVVAHTRPILVPVWALIPLGFFAGFGVIMLPLSLNFYPACLLLVILSLGSARVNGPSAAMLVLIGGIILASSTVEPSMYLATGPFARILLVEGTILLFMVLTPILVLRSRSVLGKVLGLLFPLAAYSVAFIGALSRESGLAQPMFQFSISQAVSVASPFLVLIAIVAVAAAIYAWISSAPLRPAL